MRCRGELFPEGTGGRRKTKNRSKFFPGDVYVSRLMKKEGIREGWTSLVGEGFKPERRRRGLQNVDREKDA